MSVIHDVLAAMDRADTEIALERAQAAFDAHGLSGVQQAAQELSTSLGNHILGTLCEAFGIDQDELLKVAEERAIAQSRAVAFAYGAPRSRTEASWDAGIALGGILTGLRIGLMLADRSKGGA
jgi:hypothetical protein